MKSLLKKFSAIAISGVMAVPALAGTDTAPAPTKDLKKQLQDAGVNYVETAQKGITLSGYVDTSYTEQFAGRTTPFEQGSAGTAALRQFDTNANGFNVNAVKIALEKALPDKNEWAAGFRIDAIYGSDAKYLGDSAFGQNGGTAPVVGQNNSSGLALEQALVKFRVPVGNGLDIYAGKFVTFLGYEVIESPANPNFSRGLLFTNAIPLTHTGVYGDYKFNDTFEAKFGVVDGWNSGDSPTYGSPTANGDNAFGGKAITGQLNINAPGKNANLTESFIYSPNGDTAAGSIKGTNGVWVYDLWGNWNPTFVKDSALTLGFNVDVGSNDKAWYGVALYSQYKFTKVFSLSGRAEYLHDDAPGAGAFAKYGAGGFVDHTGFFTPDSQDDYSYTLTASFNIWDNLLTRVEYRIDDLSKGTTGTHSQIDNEISLNAVYSF